MHEYITISMQTYRLYSAEGQVTVMNYLSVSIFGLSAFKNQLHTGPVFKANMRLLCLHLSGLKYIKKIATQKTTTKTVFSQHGSKRSFLLLLISIANVQLSVNV